MEIFAPIIVVDDDPDDRELITEICSRLKIDNAVIWFENGKQILDYLINEPAQPFIIICDINMPLINGLELRKIIEHNETLRVKAIPFVFLSTSATKKQIDEAYKLTIQGFFEKGTDYEKLKRRIELVLLYWKECRHPNSFDA